MTQIQKVKIGENAAGLTVHGTANDAVTGTNEMITIEEFTAAPVGLYDNETGQWIDISTDDLKNPSVINKYKDNQNIVVVLGDSMDEAEGFMNIDEYIQQVDFDDNNISESPEEKKPEITKQEQIKKEIASNPNIILNKADGGTRECTLKERIKEMGWDQEDSIVFDGHEAKLKKHPDGSSTIYFKNENGEDTWYRYDSDANLTQIRERLSESNVDKITEITNGEVTGSKYVKPGTDEPASNPQANVQGPKVNEGKSLQEDLGLFTPNENAKDFDSISNLKMNENQDLSQNNISHGTSATSEIDNTVQNQRRNLQEDLDLFSNNNSKDFTKSF